MFTFSFCVFLWHDNGISKSSKHATDVDGNNVFVFRRVNIS
jgi:hypothetical protein